jgi:septal ring factor EnvC (AmiA/AmiB activator)
MRSKLFLFGLLAFCVTFAALASSNKNQIQSNLNELQNQISNLQGGLKSDHSHRAQVLGELKTIQTQRDQIAQSLKKTQQSLKTQKEKLLFLIQQRQNYQQQLSAQTQLFGQQLRIAYQTQDINYLKILLSQDGISQISREVTYYRYLTQARLNQLQHMQETMENLAQTEQAIEDQEAQLAELNANHQKELLTQEKNQQQQQSVLSHLNESIDSKQQRLATLLANKQALENLLTRLQTQSHSHHFFKSNALPSSGGSMPWPTFGQLQERFGDAIEGQLRATGVVITAPEGQPVKAIANGQVVFSDSMPGYGELIIVDHGNGFMSLYGRNKKLYKTVGDLVHTGDTIASVGKTGGYAQSGLYFALRRQGKPLDPALWCSTRVNESSQSG